MMEPKWIFENGKFVAIKWVAVEEASQVETEDVILEAEPIKQAS